MEKGQGHSENSHPLDSNAANYWYGKYSEAQANLNEALVALTQVMNWCKLTTMEHYSREIPTEGTVFRDCRFGLDQRYAPELYEFVRKRE